MSALLPLAPEAVTEVLLHQVEALLPRTPSDLVAQLRRPLVLVLAALHALAGRGLAVAAPGGVYLHPDGLLERVAGLLERPMTVLELSAASGIPVPAAVECLRRLRGQLRVTEDRGAWGLTPPADAVALAASRAAGFRSAFGAAEGR